MSSPLRIFVSSKEKRTSRVYITLQQYSTECWDSLELTTTVVRLISASVTFVRFKIVYIDSCIVHGWNGVLLDWGWLGCFGLPMCGVDEFKYQVINTPEYQFKTSNSFHLLRGTR